MDQHLEEIVVLKPTTVFLGFLASQQLPKTQMPSYDLLQSDCTAYVIKKCDHISDTVNQVKKNVSTMFRHEIRRWLGPDANNRIENSFLDFTCCFKLEFHSHIILIDSNITKNTQLIAIKPRMPLLKWLQNEALQEEKTRHLAADITLPHITENATVLINTFEQLKEIKPYIKDYYKYIFDTAMSRMSNESNRWPFVNSFESFNQYFGIEIHTQLIQLPL